MFYSLRYSLFIFEYCDIVHVTVYFIQNSVHVFEFTIYKDKRHMSNFLSTYAGVKFIVYQMIKDKGDNLPDFDCS